MRTVIIMTFILISSELFATNKGLNFKFAQGKGILNTVEKIDSMRVLSNVHVPKAIFIPLMSNGDNMDFAENLYNIVVDINESEGLLDSNQGLYQDIDFIAIGESYFVNQFKSRVSKTRYLKTIKSKGELYDRWFQDWGEFVATGVTEDGTPAYGVYYVNRGRGLKEIVKEISRMLGIPFIESASKSGSGGDNGGNLEAAPDGTIIVGDTMHDAQIDQLRRTSNYSPMAILMTDWLAVGHVDETMAVIPSNNNCRYPGGFSGDRANYSILASDPILALEVILNYRGKQTMIYGDSNHSGSSAYRISTLKKAIQYFLVKNKTKRLSFDDFEARDIDEIISGDAGKSPCYKYERTDKYCRFVEYNIAVARDILSFNQEVLEYETPCINDDIVSIPELYHFDPKDGYGIALLPGMANLVVLRDHLIVPDPTFDGFKKSLTEIVAPKIGGKNKIHFIMDKAEYHNLMGEVHCGTNVFREVNFLIDLAD